MRERTRVLICRVAFVAACLLPTVCTLLWACSAHLPGERRAHEHQLSELLGLRITLLSVGHPRPGVTVYGGLRGAEPELGVAVLEVDRLEAVANHEGLLLRAGRADIETDGLGPIWQSLERRLQNTLPGKTRLYVEEVTWQSDGQEWRSTALDALLEPTHSGVQIGMVATPAGEEKTEQLRFRIVRNRQSSPAVTTWELVTGATPLPCSLIRSLLPGVAHIGEAACFQGSIWATRANQSGGWQAWTGQMTGELSKLKMEHLLTNRLPHIVTGPTRVLVHHARFDQGRIEEVTVSLFSGPGTIDHRLLSQVKDALGFVPTKVNESEAVESDVLDYRQLGLAFRINAEGLAVRGVCDGEPAGTVLTAAGGPLLREPRAAVQPLAGLFQLVGGKPADGVPLVALSAETAYLASILPLARENRGGRPK
jgi:hypothetical protein